MTFLLYLACSLSSHYLFKLFHRLIYTSTGIFIEHTGKYYFQKRIEETRQTKREEEQHGKPKGNKDKERLYGIYNFSFLLSSHSFVAAGKTLWV